jgi:O-antigen ligase
MGLRQYRRRQWRCYDDYHGAKQVPAWLLPRYLILKRSAHQAKTPQPGRFSLADTLRLLGLCLLALGWLWPNKIPPWASFFNEAAACAGFILLLASCWRADRSRLPAGIAVFLALIFGSSLLQLLTGKALFASDIYSLWAWLALIGLGVLAGMASCRETESGDSLATPLAVAIASAAVLSAAIAFYQWNGGTASLYILNGSRASQPIANLGQPNHLATLLVMGLACLLYLFESGKLKRFILVALGLGLLFAVAMTESRSGALNVVVLAAWWVFCARRIKFRLPLGFVLSGLAGFLLLVYFWADVCQLLGYASIRGESRLAAGSRPVMWAQMLAAIGRQPWGGYGWLQTASAQNAVADLFLSSENTLYAHNLLIDLVVWAGAPVGLLLGAMLVIWAWRRALEVRSLVPWFCMAGLLPLALHSLLEYPYAYLYFVLPASLLVGILEGCRPAGAAVSLRPGWLVALVIPVIAYFSAQLAEYPRIEEDFRVVRMESARYGKPPADYQALDIHVNTQLGAMLASARIKIRPGMPPAEQDLLRRVSLRFPWSELLFRYALSLALNGQADEADRQLQVLRSLHGERQFKGARERLIMLRDTEYPQLAVLKTL